MINWAYYPRSDSCPGHVRDVVEVFEAVSDEIDSSTHAGQVSNVAPGQSGDTVYCIGFACETIGQAGQVAAMYAPQRLAQIG